MDWDSELMRFAADHRASWATAAADGCMAVGTTLSVLGVAALVGLVLIVRSRAYRLGASAVCALVSAVVVTAALKDLFDRPRPPADLALVHAAGASFPSTQAAQTAAVATVLVLMVRWASRARAWTVGSGLAAGIVAVGACMVYLGAHWPSDILAGWALGVVLGGGTAAVCRRMPRRPAMSTQD